MPRVAVLCSCEHCSHDYAADESLAGRLQQKQMVTQHMICEQALEQPTPSAAIDGHSVPQGGGRTNHLVSCCGPSHHACMHCAIKETVSAGATRGMQLRQLLSPHLHWLGLLYGVLVGPMVQSGAAAPWLTTTTRLPQLFLRPESRAGSVSSSGCTTPHRLPAVAASRDLLAWPPAARSSTHAKAKSNKRDRIVPCFVYGVARFA